MKFKRSTKKVSTKKTTSSPVKESKELLTKEEIKELVEETVDEVFKEQEEKQPTQHDGKAVPTSELEDAVPAEKPEEISTSANLGKGEEQDVKNEEDELPEDAEHSTADEKEKEPLATPVSIESTPVTTTPSPTTSEQNTESAAQIKEPADNIVRTDETTNTSTMPVISVNGVAANSGGGSVLSDDKKQNKKTSLILLFIVFLICGFVVGISILYILSKNNFKLSSVPYLNKVVTTPSPVVVNTPTPHIANIASYTIRVLNGSGVAGAAARAKDDLIAVGFTVDSTGNATEDTTDTTVAAKSTVDQGALAKLLQTLAAKYTVSSHMLPLAGSESVDIVVTLGKAK